MRVGNSRAPNETYDLSRRTLLSRRTVVCAYFGLRLNIQPTTLARDEIVLTHVLFDRKLSYHIYIYTIFKIVTRLIE